MVLQGYAELPLHDGHVPPYLLQYMKRLGRAIAMYVVEEFGPSTLIKRLADPFWFQAFNNVIGMDWDSSGSTTVVLYVLKSFANVNTFKDVGFAVLGGKGSDARDIKDDIEKLAQFGLDSSHLRYVSKLSAKIDSVALQDGFNLYVHGLIISEDSLWTVVQQGMNTSRKMARRYHIHTDFLTVEKDPHRGIACNKRSYVLNLVDLESWRTRKTVLDLLSNPRQVVKDIAYINRLFKKDKSLEVWVKKFGSKIDAIIKDRYKDVAKLSSINPLFYRPITNVIRIEKTLEKLANVVINSFDELIIQESVGPELVRALALVADIIYNDKPSFRDPVTHVIDPFAYAFAHGGKDGIPFPIRLDVMKETIEFLEDAISNTNIEYKLKRKALENLYQYWRLLQNIMWNTVDT